MAIMLFVGFGLAALRNNDKKNAEIANLSARIKIKTNNPIEPIRVGDIVDSPAWSPNLPTRFALVGKMDVNRDDKDDRDKLKHAGNCLVITDLLIFDVPSVTCDTW